MRVSVIIPVYKVEPYIEKCILSVLQQTYHEIELMLVDDCTPDKSMYIAKNTIDNYLLDSNREIKVVYLRQDSNKGVSAARNTGIREATGDWLFFLDSDDWITADCIESMMEMVKKYPQVEVVQASVIGDMSWLKVNGKGLPEYSEDRAWIKNCYMRDNLIPAVSWNKLLNRKFICENKLFFQEGVAISEDVTWTWFLSKYICKIVFLEKDTYFYTQHDSSAIHGDKMKIINAQISANDKFVHSIDSFCRDAQISYCFDRVSSLIWSVTTEKHIRDVNEQIRALAAQTAGVSKILLSCYAMCPMWLKQKHRLVSFIKKMLK